MVNRSFISPAVRIKAVGVGGGGCNAINRMVRAGIYGVDFIAVNTDAQVLMMNEAPTRIQIGEKATRGLGAGGDPGVGQAAAEESIEELKLAVRGAHMVFIAAGMGGGTGTGAAPVTAKLARESGALTIGVVTKPFNFEMARRGQIAEEGISNLEQEVDALIVVPNERLLKITGDKVTVDGAFKMADDVLMTGVRTITEIITLPGLINVDFADVSAIMRNAGPCRLATGYGSGQNRVVEAARAAITSELLDIPIAGAMGMVYEVSGPSNLTLSEVRQAAEIIESAVDEEAMVIFGVTLNPKLHDDVSITLVATGFTPYKAAVKEQKDEEFRRLIRELQYDESRMETPAFMRRPVDMRRMSRKA
ncbi:MAG: cell division protein FtsZ [Dehalococcoidia bacterium]|nr:cell division protein FtsZ [Dehalococcoidia bacterium]